MEFKRSMPNQAKLIHSAEINYDQPSFDNMQKEFIRYLNKWSGIRFRWLLRSFYLSVILVVAAILIKTVVLSEGQQISALNVISSISFIYMFFVGIAILFYWLGTRKDDKKIFDKLKSADYKQPAKYDFYDFGLVAKEPHQQGTFFWGDFFEACIVKDLLCFAFCPPGTEKGKETQDYAAIIIPLAQLGSYENLIHFLQSSGQLDFTDYRAKHLAMGLK